MTGDPLRDAGERPPVPELVVGWSAIAYYLGVSEANAKNIVYRAGFRLGKSGRGGRTSPVQITRDGLELLRTLLRQ